MTLFALALLCCIGESVYNRWFRNHSCDDEYCYHSEYVNRDIYFHNTEDGKGYIYNKRTGKKLIRHIARIAKPTDKDSLICFSNGKKRGYFSKNTGKVVIEPKYSHAWIFSDGLASVEEDGYIKFIDATGKVVIDNIVQHFKSKGYKVGINEPFSNSKTFAVPVEYHSVMIEVNKRLYMDEQTLEKTEGFEKLKQDIQSLYGTLLKD